MWNLIPQKGIPPTRVQRYCCKVLKETSTPNRMAVLGVRSAESSGRAGRDVFGTRGGTLEQATFFSMAHTSEVYRESLTRGEVWDCTLIKNMRENKDTVVNPIYEWTDANIWDYINQESIETNPLYKRGYRRVGCIGCPMAGYHQMLKEFADYPTYKENYIKAFQRLIDRREENGKINKEGGHWGNGEELFNWWVGTYKHEVEGQLSLFGGR